PEALRRVAGVIVVLGLLGAFVGLAAPRRQVDSSRTGISLLPLLGVVGAYSAFILVAKVVTNLDPVDTRLLSPLFIPLLVLGVVAIERLDLLMPARARSLITPVVVALLVLFMLGQALVFTREVRRSTLGGRGYASRSWQSSALANAAKEVPPTALLYSNDPWGIWAVDGREPILFSPTAHYPGSKAKSY